MPSVTSVSFYLVMLMTCIMPPILSAQPSDNPLIAWHSETGRQRFADAQFKIDFFRLVNHFQAQLDNVSCGPTTGAIILNALRLYRQDKRVPYVTRHNLNTQYLPAGVDIRVKMYHQDNFIGLVTRAIKSRQQIFGEPINGKSDFGLQIRQLHRMFLAHGAVSRLRIADNKLPVEQMRAEMITNLQSEHDYIVVNYARKSLGQDGGGHISPVAAYHQASDSFLILDVTADRHSWVWVPTEKLYQAMASFDMVENRGYLLIHDTPAMTVTKKPENSAHDQNSKSHRSQH